MGILFNCICGITLRPEQNFGLRNILERVYQKVSSEKDIRDYQKIKVRNCLESLEKVESKKLMFGLTSIADCSPEDFKNLSPSGDNVGTACGNVLNYIESLS